LKFEVNCDIKSLELKNSLFISDIKLDLNLKKANALTHGLVVRYILEMF